MTVRSGRRRRDWDGWPYRPLCARWFSAPPPFAKDESRAATGLSQAHGVLWLGTLGHPLIESKTPFHGRFEVPALFLPNRANNAISGPP